MSLHLHEDEKEIYFGSDLLGVKRNGGIELWASDGETLYGLLPENATEQDAIRAYKFFMDGYAVGKKMGALEKLHEIRSILGI